MAERSKTHSRTNSARRPSSGARNSATNIKNDISKPSNELLNKEEQYKRLNEELEAKTANLVREAEEIMREQDSMLTKTSLLDNINTEDFLNEWEESDDQLLPHESKKENKQLLSARPPSKTTNHSRPQSQTKLTKPSSGKLKARGKSNLADDVAVPDETFMTDFRDFSLQQAITNIEGQLDTGQLQGDCEDVLPSAAAEMGAEAQIRFLKAKLRVMQEELDRLAEDCNKREEENNSLVLKIKELEEERGRLHRTNASQQTQIEKYKRLADDTKNKAESLDTQLIALRKETDALKRSQKQQQSSQSATEVRLNRALEEVEKYKLELQKSKTSTKESAGQERRKTEQLMAENKRLEKQKNELMGGFKKQLKLIDILKRQKMHIEAAKMLQFSEEEFVKALEWGN